MNGFIDRIIVNDFDAVVVIIEHDPVMGRVSHVQHITHEEVALWAAIPGVKVEDLREEIQS